MTTGEPPPPANPGQRMEAIFFEFTAELLPPDRDEPGRKRLGRPAYLPPIPADELARQLPPEPPADPAD